MDRMDARDRMDSTGRSIKSIRFRIRYCLLFLKRSTTSSIGPAM